MKSKLLIFGLMLSSFWSEVRAESWAKICPIAALKPSKEYIYNSQTNCHQTAVKAKAAGFSRPSNLPNKISTAEVCPYVGVKPTKEYFIRNEIQCFPSARVAESKGYSKLGSAKPTPTTPTNRTIAFIYVAPAQQTLNEGQTRSVIVIPYNSANQPVSIVGRTVTWQSSNPGVASVTPASVGASSVKAVSGGTATITVTVGGHKASAEFTVIGKTPVQNIVIEQTVPSSSVAVGEYSSFIAIPLRADGVPVSGHSITWESSNRLVGQINSLGSFRGMSPGVTTISATTGGETASRTFRVTAVPTPTPAATGPRVVVSPAVTIIQQGQTKSFVSMLFDQNNKVVPITGKNVTWKSSTPSVGALVSGWGHVHGAQPGVTDITCTIDGISATARLYVAASFGN